MNKWIGTGNLIADPERIQANEKMMSKMRIAVRENYTKDGERQSQIMTIIAWNKIAENILKYLKKGNKVAIVGKISNRSYEASDGQKKYVSEIIAEEVEFLYTGQPLNQEN